MKTYIFSKNSNEISEFSACLEIRDIKSCELRSITPNGLAIEYEVIDDRLKIVANGGQNGVTYNCQLMVNTSIESILIQVVILVSDSQFNPIVNSAPDSFMDLVGTMQAGNSTVSTVVFNLPDNPDNGYVTWELINNESQVLSSGNAFTYYVDNNGLDNIVTAQCLIICPSDTEPTTQGRRYQIRYSLVLDDNTIYQYETLRVESNVTVPLGACDIVELVGKKITLSIVLPQLYSKVSVCIYADNQPVVPVKTLTNPQRVSSGWLYSAGLDSRALAVSIDSYDVVYEFSNHDYEVNSESAKLWIINPSIRSAADDILAKVQKARATLYGSTDLVFTIPTLLTWLRRGRDLFNGWQGLFTSFTMTNAKGVIREYWLLCSELGALEAQYLAEGEKAFNFSGAAIQLDVDRTGFLDSMINAIRSNLDQNLKPIKQNMISKGYTSGDGAGTDGQGGIAANPRALGTVGISITPASAWGRFYPGYLIGRAWI